MAFSGADPTVTAQTPPAGEDAAPGTVVALEFEASTPPSPAPAAESPLVVNTTSVDDRVSNWANLSIPNPQLVAVAPGLYVAYNSAVADLNFYVDNGTAEGDCTLIKAMFSDRGSTCWDGVKAGSEEPH